MTNTARAAGAGVFFVEDHLLGQRCALAAVFLGPADTGPARRAHGAFPFEAFFKHFILEARAATMTDMGEGTFQLGFQPGGGFGAEGGKFGGFNLRHGYNPRPVAMRSRWARASPNSAALARARLK